MPAALAANAEFVVGIDAGGTKSHVVIWRSEHTSIPSANQDVLQQAISNQRFLGINLDVVDDVRARERFLTIMESTAQSVNVPLRDFLSRSHIVMGMAGLDTQLDLDSAQTWLNQMWDELGVTPAFKLIPDIELALWSASPDGTGIVVISGTGSNCFGRNAQGKAAKTGGMSHFFSDEGSGFMLGWLGLHAITKMHDGREPKTALYDELLREYGAQSLSELKRQVVQHPDYKQEVARGAPAVQRMAAAGDTVAAHIVQGQVEELVRMVSTVQAQLNVWETMIFPVGGAFADQAYFEAFRTQVEHLGLHVQPSRITAPVIGALPYAAAQSVF